MTTNKILVLDGARTLVGIFGGVFKEFPVTSWVQSSAGPTRVNLLKPEMA